MATATRKLFVNLATKRLQQSLTNGGEFILPNFNKYETTPFEVVIVEPDNSARGLPAWSKVDISNLALAISLNDTYDDASPLAYQNTFTKDESTDTFSGELSLNTSALNTWLGSSEYKSGYFEIQITEGTSVIKAYLATVRVNNAVAQVGAVVPTPVDEYYTKAQMDALFLQFVNEPGRQLTLTSPGNVKQRIIGISDEGDPIDQIVDV